VPYVRDQFRSFHAGHRLIGNEKIERMRTFGKEAFRFFTIGPAGDRVAQSLKACLRYQNDGFVVIDEEDALSFRLRPKATIHEVSIHLR
jgi:hypothetical protein